MLHHWILGWGTDKLFVVCGGSSMDDKQLHLGNHDQVYVPLVLVVHVELRHRMTSMSFQVRIVQITGVWSF